MRGRKVIAVLFLVASIVLQSYDLYAQYEEANISQDINTRVMMATVLVSGQGSEGTGFLIGRPLPKDPNRLRFTLITADHVLRAIKGETAVLHHRRLNQGKWETVPTVIKIRTGNQMLWAKHPEADVAAMYVPVPKVARPVVMPY
jgi:hypothetical protein